MVKSFVELIKEARRAPAFWAHRAKLQFATSLHDLLRHRQMSQTAFAHRLGVSEAYVSRVLSGDENLTIVSMTKAASAVDGYVDLEVKPSEAAFDFGTLDQPLYRSSQTIRFEVQSDGPRFGTFVMAPSQKSSVNDARENAREPAAA